jgi:asparagine synthase (glutamine-hydrolysing)
VADADVISQVSYLELNAYLSDTLLRDVDVMSMAHSLEVRVPLLDHKLVEYIATIPSNLKLNGTKTKYIFKESIKDLVPMEILLRKKMGFGFPMGIWMGQDRLRRVVDDCLSKKSVEKRGMLRYEEVIKVYTAFYHHGELPTQAYQIYQRVWLLTVLELWCRRYLDG